MLSSILIASCQIQSYGQDQDKEFLTLNNVETNLSEAKRMVNVDYLASGYNIFYGNPETTQSGSDPGFKAQIFEFTYEKKLITADGRYMVPDDTFLRQNFGCQLNFESTIISGSKSYSNSLEESASASVGYEGAFSAKFSASVDYKTVSTGSSSYSNTYTNSKTECSVYTGGIQPYEQPKFTSGFQKGLKTLSSNYDQDAYRQFLDGFGTHYLEEITMGAKYGILTKFSESNWKKMIDTRLQVDVAASASAWGVSGSAHSTTTSEKKQSEEFNSKKSGQREFSLGSKPPASGKSQDWLQQTIAEPMPIRYKLQTIDNLFKKGSAQQKNIKQALTDYCEALKKNGVVKSCAGPGNDPVLPKVDNACRFCRSCGNTFTQDGGEIVVDQNWPNWLFSYDNSCSGELGHHSTSGGVHLCCQQEQQNKFSGECKICGSCGGEYKYEAGGMMCDQNWPNWIRSYDNQCNGDMRNRDKSSTCQYMCCKTEPICSMCNSCGGDFPNETSVLSNDQNWPNFFRQRGDQCSGSVRRQSRGNKISVCCKSSGVPIF